MQGVGIKLGVATHTASRLLIRPCSSSFSGPAWSAATTRPELRMPKSKLILIWCKDEGLAAFFSRACCDPFRLFGSLEWEVWGWGVGGLGGLGGWSVQEV